MGSFGPLEWVIIILIIVLFFGARKIPDMARGLAQGYVEFRKASLDDKSDDETEQSEHGKKQGPSTGEPQQKTTEHTETKK